jgi:heme-degrading monooxygenase HmoA
MSDPTDAGRSTDAGPRRAPGSPLLVRIWRGATEVETADDYLAYLETTGFAEYRSTPGNRGVLALRRIVDGRAELLLLTAWESEEAIRRFAGHDIERAVFYPEDDRFLVERDELVRHYQVVHVAGWGEGLAGR